MWWARWAAPFTPAPSPRWFPMRMKSRWQRTAGAIEDDFDAATAGRGFHLVGEAAVSRDDRRVTAVVTRCPRDRGVGVARLR